MKDGKYGSQKGGKINWRKMEGRENEKEGDGGKGRERRGKMKRREDGDLEGQKRGKMSRGLWTDGDGKEGSELWVREGQIQGDGWEKRSCHEKCSNVVIFKLRVEIG